MNISVYPHKKFIQAHALFALRPIFLFWQIRSMWENEDLAKLPFPFDMFNQTRIDILNGWTLTVGDRSFHDGGYIDPAYYHWQEFTTRTLRGDLPRKPWDDVTWGGCILKWVGSSMSAKKAASLWAIMREAQYD